MGRSSTLIYCIKLTIFHPIKLLIYWCLTVWAVKHCRNTNLPKIQQIKKHRNVVSADSAY